LNEPDGSHAAASEAVAFYKAGSYKEAMLRVRQLVATLPKDESVLATLIEICCEDNDTELAQMVAMGAAQLVPEPSASLKSLIDHTAQRYQGLRPDRAFTARMQAALSNGAYLVLRQALADVMKTVPCWPAGWAFRGIASYLTLVPGPASALELDRHPDVSTELEPLASDLAVARERHVAAAVEDLQRAAQLDPANAGVWRYLAMAKFASGQTLSEAEEQFLLQASNSATTTLRIERARINCAKGMALQGVCDYQAIRAPQVLQVPEPGSHGQPFASLSGVGVALLGESYLAEWTDVLVRARSNLVVTEHHGVACDILSHPLASLASTDYDQWIVARSAAEVLLARQPDALEVDGLAVSLLGPAASEYGHWLIEFAPRIEALERHSDLRNATFLVEADMPATHIQSLEMLLGFHPKVLAVPKGSEVRVPRLLTAAGGAFYPRACLQGAPMLPTVAATHPQDMQFLRARVHQRLQASEALAPADSPKRIYVQRRSPLRKLLNQEAIEALLVSKYDFSLIDPSAMDFSEQMRVFANAELVVGANGSAMHNCFACREGTKVVTLVGEDVGHLPSWSYALKTMGIDHLFAVGRGQNTHAWRQHWDYEVDLAVVEQCVAPLLEQGGASPESM
jgi:capsular polysaccharide biosynthesis protein